MELFSCDCGTIIVILYLRLLLPSRTSIFFILLIVNKKKYKSAILTALFCASLGAASLNITYRALRFESYLWVMCGIEALLFLYFAVKAYKYELNRHEVKEDKVDDSDGPSAPEYSIVDDDRVKAAEYQGFVKDAQVVTSACDATTSVKLLSEDDFNGLKSTIRHLTKLLWRISRDKKFFKQIKSVARDRDALTSDFGPKDVYLSLTLCLFKDVKYCCDHLNVSDDMDFNTAVGQALLEITVLIRREDDVQYEDYGYFMSLVTGHDEINERLKSTLKEKYNYCRDQDKVKITSETVDDFMLVMLLDATERQHYLPEMRKWLNRLTEQIAGIAGMTEERKKWLKLLAERRANEADGRTGSSSVATIEDLNNLIGLNRVKAEVTAMKNFIEVNQRREQAGMKTTPVSYHCVFMGNPGTGKTTVARIVAGIYKSMGVLKKGHLVETDRSGLVAEYVGQTAVKTNKIIDSALDGVLFIDEAYSLVSAGKEDFGKEAIATLVKRMEDDRNRLVVILAGYALDMEQFIESNPGLRSRFNRYIHFEDYTADELLLIFKRFLDKYDYTIGIDAEQELHRHLEKCASGNNMDFGNARYVRNLFEKTIEAQAVRLAAKPYTNKEELATITVDDITAAIVDNP